MIKQDSLHHEFYCCHTSWLQRSPQTSPWLSATDPSPQIPCFHDTSSASSTVCGPLSKRNIQKKSLFILDYSPVHNLLTANVNIELSIYLCSNWVQLKDLHKAWDMIWAKISLLCCVESHPRLYGLLLSILFCFLHVALDQHVITCLGQTGNYYLFDFPYEVQQSAMTVMSQGFTEAYYPLLPQVVN